MLRMIDHQSYPNTGGLLFSGNKIHVRLHAEEVKQVKKVK
jgi:hypothetical protein